MIKSTKVVSKYDIIFCNKLIIDLLTFNKTQQNNTHIVGYMIVTKELIKKIAKNASLEITEEETDMFIKNFTTIGDWIEKIKNVDISNTEPTINPLYDQDNINLTNNDEAEDVYTDKIFSNTKHHDGEYFLVNKVIK